MSLYRKKPVVIAAKQWDGSRASIERIADWMYESLEVTGDVLSVRQTSDDDETFDVQIRTLEGPHHVSPGDYIIRGVEGEYYACKPGIFHQTYEAVV